ncbi:polyprenol phosphomannose-dependent alpha 1,6 mannosyltransferase MptB [Pseudonocardia phyllosphaerae]|uniref:polyprenol phosphomannose-dependent alpha 1,6 mannosyltransferase MptB n=1 Tax=Pseudonocardia phyllosphaerae TaxID=3390502 RepID=UPI00397BE65D
MVRPEVAPAGREDRASDGSAHDGAPDVARTDAGPAADGPAGRTGAVAAGPPRRRRGTRPRRGLRDQARIARRLGLTGSLLMAYSALGSGAFPVPNPLNGLRLIGLPARNVTLAIAVTYAGLLMVVTSWVWIARMLTSKGAHHPAPERRELGRTAILWGLPLALAPPMFTKDIYSYLAQSATLARGIDPYTIGPAQALGISDPLVGGIPTIWRDTPAPYGPLFLGLGRIITAFSGENVVLGIFEHRLLALVGVAAMVWVLPRLAQRFGVDEGLVVWLGAANPLVLFHLVSGIHNESIMLPLLLLGLWVALGRDDTPLPWWRISLGAALIVGAASVKLPALLALGFVGVHLVRRAGGRWKDWVAITSWFSVIAVVVLSAFSFATGLGFNWLKGLSAPSAIRSWFSVSTDLGMIAGQLGRVLGLGDHSDATLDLARNIGWAAVAVLVAYTLLKTARGKLDPVTGTAAGLGAVVLLGPVVHPWYLFWGLMPLITTNKMPRYRRAMLAFSAVIALLVPPTGTDFMFRAFQLPLSVIAGLVMFALSLVVVRYALRAPTGPAGSAGSAPDHTAAA